MYKNLQYLKIFALAFALAFACKSFAQIAEMNSEIPGEWVRKLIEPKCQLYTDSPLNIVITATDTYYTITGLEIDTALLCNATDSSIIPSRSGWYEVYDGFSYQYSVVNTVIHHCVFVNDIERTVIESERTITTPGNTGDSGRQGLLYLNAGDTVKVKFKADKTGTITITHGNFNIKI